MLDSYRVYGYSMDYKKCYIVIDVICGGNKVEEGINPVLELNAVSFPDPIQTSLSLIEYTRLPKALNNMLGVKIKPYAKVNNFFLEKNEKDIYSYIDGLNLSIAANMVSDYLKEHLQTYEHIIFVSKSDNAEQALKFLLKNSKAPELIFNIKFDNSISVRPQLKIRGGSINSECYRYSEAVFNYIRFTNKIEKFKSSKAC